MHLDLPKADHLGFSLARENFRGIQAQKIDLEVEQVIETIRHRHNIDAFYITARSLANVLYATRGFNEAFSFIKRAVDIDKSFRITYSILGKRLYAFGKVKESQKCFTQLIRIDSEDENALEMLTKIQKKRLSPT